MDPNDPIAQSIDFDLAEGMTDPTRAAAIMRILPQLTGAQPNTRPIGDYSGLPQTGGQALADVAAGAGQLPSGVPGDTRMPSLGDIYMKRATLQQAADRDNAFLENQRTSRAIQFAQMMGKGGQWEPIIKDGKVIGQRHTATGEIKGSGLDKEEALFAKPDPTKFTPESLGAFQKAGGRDYSVLVPREDSQMAPLPSVPGVFYTKGRGGVPQMIDASGNPLSTEQVQAMELAAKRAGATNVVNNIPADEKRSEPFEVTINGSPTMIRQDQRGNNYFAHNGEPVPKDVRITPKIGEVQKKQVTGAENTRDALTAYRNILKTWTPTDIVSPNARAKMGTVYNNALLQAKEAYNLGVLNGPDYMILQSVLTDPAGWKGAITSKRALDAQAKKLDEILSKIQGKVSGKPQRTIKRTGTSPDGRKVVEYDDGTLEYQ